MSVEHGHGYTKKELINLGAEIVWLYMRELDKLPSLIEPLLEEMKAHIDSGGSPDQIGYGPMLNWYRVVLRYRQEFPVDTLLAGQNVDPLHLLHLIVTDERYLSDVKFNVTQWGEDVLKPCSDLIIRDARRVIERCGNNTILARNAVATWIVDSEGAGESMEHLDALMARTVQEELERVPARQDQ